MNQPPPQWDSYIKKHGWGASHTLRCREYETRLTSDHARRPFKYNKRTVRCALWAGHPGDHTWHGRTWENPDG